MTELNRNPPATGHAGPGTSDRLLPLVYDELRRLAARKLAREKTGHTLQATALVHEAFLRLVGPADEQRWDSRGHFFAAAAEAMRRILIDRAREKQATKRGGGRERLDVDAVDLATRATPTNSWRSTTPWPNSPARTWRPHTSSSCATSGA
jgi:RNA polymerase sigma factor (TIGR02999 family)